MENSFKIKTALPLDSEDREMALLLVEVARKGAQLGSCGRMCSDCAFRIGHQLTEEKLEGLNNAAYALATYGRFICHTREDPVTNKFPTCAGFLYAKQYFDNLEKSI